MFKDIIIIGGLFFAVFQYLSDDEIVVTETPVDVSCAVGLTKIKGECGTNRLDEPQVPAVIKVGTIESLPVIPKLPSIPDNDDTDIDRELKDILARTAICNVNKEECKAIANDSMFSNISSGGE